MEQNIRDQYWLEYQHYDEEYRTELEREIIRMRTRGLRGFKPLRHVFRFDSCKEFELAEKLGCARSTVRYNVGKLAAAGLIVITKECKLDLSAFSAFSASLCAAISANLASHSA